MLIKIDRRIIEGEHLGVPFKYDGGLLIINGQSYSKAEIKTLVNLANLLELEGFSLAESKPMGKNSSIVQTSWGNFLKGRWYDDNDD